MCVRVCVRAHVCVCVCVCVRPFEGVVQQALGCSGLGAEVGLEHGPGLYETQQGPRRETVSHLDTLNPETHTHTHTHKYKKKPHFVINSC